MTVIDRPTVDASATPDTVIGAIGDTPTPTARQSVSARRTVRIGAAMVIAFVLGFALYVSVISDVMQGRNQDQLLERFRSDLVNGMAPVNGPIAPGTAVAFLEIPSVGVEQVVVEGTTPSTLLDAPGHLPGSPLPGQPGVSAILGRLSAGGGPFARLHELEAGDEVVVTTGQGRHEYTVLDSTERVRSDASAFIGEGNMLLLITGDSSPQPDRRLVVRAQLTSDVQAAGTATSTGPADVGDLGLDGDASAVAPLLAWMLLLAVVGISGVLVAPRVGRRTTWVLLAPPVALISMAVWENALLLFPALA